MVNNNQPTYCQTIDPDIETPYSLGLDEVLHPVLIYDPPSFLQISPDVFLKKEISEIIKQSCSFVIIDQVI